MDSRSNYIPDDGYTEKGYVKTDPGLHDQFRFTFRPMLVEEQTKMFEASDKIDPVAYNGKAAEVMADKLVTWNLVDKTATPVAIKPENILRLKPRLFTRVYGIILGTQSTDIDPEWSGDERAEKAQQQYASALSGNPPGAEHEVNDAKNFNSG